MHLEIQCPNVDLPPRPKTSSAKFITYNLSNLDNSQPKSTNVTLERKHSLASQKSSLRHSKGESFRIQLENEYKSRATRPIINETLLKENITENLVDKFLKNLSDHNRSPKTDRPLSARPSFNWRDVNTFKVRRVKLGDSANGRSQSQLVVHKPTEHFEVDILKIQRLIKSAPSKIAVYLPDANRRDAQFLRTKVNYVDMSAVYPEEDEMDSISMLSNTIYYESKEKLKETANKIKARLKKIKDEELVEAVNNKRKMSNVDKMSILRERKPTIIQSMPVDKWIEVHKRRNKCTALHFLNKNILLTDGKENDSYVKNKMAKTQSKSVRELIATTVLDNVQKKVKVELEQTLKNIKRIETNTEFNMLIDKVRYFLHDWEEENVPNSRKAADKKPITLYYKNLQDTNTSLKI